MKRIYNCLFTRMVFISLVVIFVTSPVSAIPPDPDNAALLYYQGFLSLVELDEEALDHIADVARGNIAPDDKVRQDISQCMGAIQFAEAAAQVLACNWGVRYSQGFECLLPQMAQSRFLTFVLVADARIRASDGDYKGALERCLMTVKFAHHVGDDTFISYLVSLSVRTLAYKCTQDIVGRIGSDEELLEWFKNEFAISRAWDLSPVRPLKIELELVTDLMQMDSIEKLSRIMADSDEEKVEEIMKVVDEKILEQARRIYSDRMNSAMIIFSGSTPYELAYAQLKESSTDFDPNYPPSAGAGVFVPALDSILTSRTRVETHANAIQAAVEILLTRIKTGQLPDTLPIGLPKDVFSSKDFIYEKTGDGFILRCQGKDLLKEEIHQYEFKISK